MHYTEASEHAVRDISELKFFDQVVQVHIKQPAKYDDWMIGDVESAETYATAPITFVEAFVEPGRVRKIMAHHGPVYLKRERGKQMLCFQRRSFFGELVYDETFAGDDGVWNQADYINDANFLLNLTALAAKGIEIEGLNE